MQLAHPYSPRLTAESDRLHAPPPPNEVDTRFSTSNLDRQICETRTTYTALLLPPNASSASCSASCSALLILLSGEKASQCYFQALF